MNPIKIENGIILEQKFYLFFLLLVKHNENIRKYGFDPQSKFNFGKNN